MNFLTGADDKSWCGWRDNQLDSSVLFPGISAGEHDRTNQYLSGGEPYGDLRGISPALCPAVSVWYFVSEAN